MISYKETNYENAIIELFQSKLNYDYIYAPNIERDFRSPLYDEVLEESLFRINKSAPYDAVKEALFKLRNFENSELVQKNAVFMNYLQNGVEVRYTENGEQKSTIIYLADFENVNNNSFIISNQWTIVENDIRRPDILIFLNGLPIAIMELKSPSREEADAEKAYTQLRNYMQDIPSMFVYNAICVISDQLTTKAGTITSGEDRLMEWKTTDGSYENTQFAQFDTFSRGFFKKNGFLTLSRILYVFQMTVQSR